MVNVSKGWNAFNSVSLAAGYVTAECRYNGNGELHTNVKYAVKLSSTSSKDKIFDFVDRIARMENFQIPYKEITQEGLFTLKWISYSRPSEAADLNESFERMKTIGLRFEAEFLQGKDGTAKLPEPALIGIRT